MAKKAYIGVDGKARKIKKGYIGVDGKARKIKKAYIGIGGKARPCWSGGDKLSYYGKITQLSSNRTMLAAGTVGNYALFAGGTQDISATYTGSAYALTTVDTYNTSLVRSTTTGLTLGQKQYGCANIGGKLLFFGGNRNASAKTVDIYSSDLTKTPSATAQIGRDGCYPSYNNNYALFCGGYTADNTGLYGYVDAYNADLTHFNATRLRVYTYEGRGTKVGNYALFGGGEYYSSGNYTQKAEMNAYDGNLTRTSPTNLSVGCCNLAAESVGNYGVFVCNSMANAYDLDLTRTTITTLATAKRMTASVNFNKCAMFIGGWAVGNSNGVSTVDVYDENLTRTSATTIDSARGALAATAIDDYAIFAGGLSGSTYYNTAEAFTVV